MQQIAQTYIEETPNVELSSIVFTEDQETSIRGILDEFTFKEELNKLKLPINNKILLYGHSGCGKTLTAKAIATALNKKLISVNLGTIVSSKLGETAKNLTAIFHKAKREKALLFLDEFDSLGKNREIDQDNGEMQRIVNTLLQLIDYLPEKVFLFAATNQINLLDPAILRRFNLKISFSNPTKEKLVEFYNLILTRYPEIYHPKEFTYNISFAEAENRVVHEVKRNVLHHLKQKTSE
jgi:SpoVK/Ycf46/Vps4 family AAA+-type ATPase